MSKPILLVVLFFDVYVLCISIRFVSTVLLSFLDILYWYALHRATGSFQNISLYILLRMNDTYDGS